MKMEAMESLAEEDRQLEHLGDDVLAKIWSYLDSSSLALCACVNTDLMRTINEDQIAWRRCFEVRKNLAKISRSPHATPHISRSPQGRLCCGGDEIPTIF